MPVDERAPTNQRTSAPHVSGGDVYGVEAAALGHRDELEDALTGIEPHALALLFAYTHSAQMSLHFRNRAKARSLRVFRARDGQVRIAQDFKGADAVIIVDRDDSPFDC